MRLLLDDRGTACSIFDILISTGRCYGIVAGMGALVSPVEAAWP
jgi:hypothetical protein